MDSDADLLGAVAAGDQDLALGELYDRWAPLVGGVLAREEADDGASTLVQVFVEIWRQAGSFHRETDEPRQWVVALAHRTAGGAGEPPAADSITPVPPPSNAYAAIRRAVADDEPPATDRPMPRPSELHPATRKLITVAQRRASRAASIATFAIATAVAFGVLYVRERGRSSDLQHELETAQRATASIRGQLIEEIDRAPAPCPPTAP